LVLFFGAVEALAWLFFFFWFLFAVLAGSFIPGDGLCVNFVCCKGLVNLSLVEEALVWLAKYS